MMHPDDHDLLMRICYCVAIVWVCALSYKLGKNLYFMMERGPW